MSVLAAVFWVVRLCCPLPPGPFFFFFPAVQTFNIKEKSTFTPAFTKHTGPLFIYFKHFAEEPNTLQNSLNANICLNSIACSFDYTLV